MKISGYLQTSLIEWPGKITSVIFVSGCNFYCPFCHNSDLVDPQKIRRLPSVYESEILTDLKKRKKWIDGVVITGGEPTLQTDLSQFLSRLKKMGFSTMIETNGSQSETIKELIKRKLVDFVAMDIKAPFDETYTKVAQVGKFDPKVIKKSLELLLNSKIPFEIRTTVVPGIHDEKTLLKMASQLSALRPLPSAKFSWYLQNFQPKNCLDPSFKKIKPYRKTEIEKFLKIVKSIVPGVKIRD